MHLVQTAGDQSVVIDFLPAAIERAPQHGQLHWNGIIPALLAQLLAI